MAESSGRKHWQKSVQEAPAGSREQCSKQCRKYACSVQTTQASSPHLIVLTVRKYVLLSSQHLLSLVILERERETREQKRPFTQAVLVLRLLSPLLKIPKRTRAHIFHSYASSVSSLPIPASLLSSLFSLFSPPHLFQEQQLFCNANINIRRRREEELLFTAH